MDSLIDNNDSIYKFINDGLDDIWQSHKATFDYKKELLDNDTNMTYKEKCDEINKNQFQFIGMSIVCFSIAILLPLALSTLKKN